MDRESLHRWADMLRHNAVGTHDIEQDIQTPFLHWATSSTRTNDAPPRFDDDRLWQLVVRNDHSIPIPIDDDGPLLGTRRDSLALEVWTECELSSLQALVWLALQQSSRTLLDRAAMASRWHLEHTQPDNATNRPWGIPAFLTLALRTPPLARESELYASTLLHNTLVTSGAPDTLSARVLADAARQIDALLASPLLD
ncbi:MAG: hypothetical protein ACF8GE_06695 [Phycisphaerales bacterium JB043]